MSVERPGPGDQRAEAPRSRRVVENPEAPRSNRFADTVLKPLVENRNISARRAAGGGQDLVEKRFGEAPQVAAARLGGKGGRPHLGADGPERPLEDEEVQPSYFKAKIR